MNELEVVQQPEEQGTTRRPYQKPELTELGTVSELTQLGGTRTHEGGAFSPFRTP